MEALEWVICSACVTAFLYILAGLHLCVKWEHNYDCIMTQYDVIEKGNELFFSWSESSSLQESVQNDALAAANNGIR